MPRVARVCRFFEGLVHRACMASPRRLVDMNSSGALSCLRRLMATAVTFIFVKFGAVMPKARASAITLSSYELTRQ